MFLLHSLELQLHNKHILLDYFHQSLIPTERETNYNILFHKLFYYLGLKSMRWDWTKKMGFVLKNKVAINMTLKLRSSAHISTL